MFWLFKVINVSFQHEIYVDKSEFWRKSVFSIKFST